MNKYKKPHIQEDKLGKNPFLLTLKVFVHAIELPGQWYTDGDGHILPAEMEIEKLPFTKLFIDADRRKELSQLSSRAMGLLLWIMYETEPGKDWIWVNRKRYMEERGITTYNTYNAAVNELIRLNYLSKVASPANVFWINPHFFFNGNRAKAFPKNVIKK